MPDNLPLSTIFEMARIRFKEVFDGFTSEYNLPAWLLEPVLVNMLADVRSAKAMELVSELNAAHALEKKAAEESKKKPAKEPEKKATKK